MALYVEELLPDHFKFLNDHWQAVLQEIKESIDERAQNANQPHPNRHTESIESIWDWTAIITYIGSGNLELMKGQHQRQN